VSTDTVRKSPAHLPETPTILRLLAEITGRQPPETAAPPDESPSVAPESGAMSARDFLGRVNWHNEPARRTESQQRMNALDDRADRNHAEPFTGVDDLNADSQTGVTRNRAGARVLTLTREFLSGMATALETECGPTADAVAQSCGRAWGRRYAARLERELAQPPFADRPLAEFTDCLAAAFNHNGWGLLTLDFGHSDRGLIVADLRHSPAAGPDGMFAGLLAGLFSHFAGLALDCILTQRADGEAGVTRFVIGLSQRLGRFADAAAQGRSHDEIVGELEATQA
jgi:uncharacterized protein